MEAALRAAIDGLDTSLREHTQAAVEELAVKVHTMEVSQGLAGTPGPRAAAPAEATTVGDRFRAHALTEATLKLKLGHLQATLESQLGALERRTADVLGPAAP